MLYITTRDNKDAYTSYRTLGENRGPDGGLFLPFRIPKLDRDVIRALEKKGFSQTVADILNLFFNARLDGWDVDFCIGRYPTKMVPMSHRITVAEVWHNPDYDFARIVRNLSGRIRGTQDTDDQPTNWAWISIRIAFLFAMYGELCRMEFTDPDHPLDVAMPSGDFAAPMAAWYAREMGLPIGTIICSCDSDDPAWDLLHHGEMSTGGSVTIPSDLERLIFSTLGLDETRRYLERVGKKRPYHPPEEGLDDLRRGIFPAVISRKRGSSMIGSVYNTSTYILDPASAIAYGGLQDYRALAGGTRPALILAERSPFCSAETVAAAMGITVDALKERLKIN